MDEAIMMFTFSPVQPFIAEARRAADLYAGSQILASLSKAASDAIKKAGGRLIYPAELNNDARDMPNKVTSVVDWSRTKEIADKAKSALYERWWEFAYEAHRRLQIAGPQIDAVWENIWDRQVKAENRWEVYWAAVSLKGKTFPTALKRANQALVACKRTRVFNPGEEPGIKDSLSGRREAIHTKEKATRDYWTAIAGSGYFHEARLRSNGRERLDAIGAIKRFCKLGDKAFPSTSTIAASDYIALAKEKASTELNDYAVSLKKLSDSFIASEDLFSHSTLDWIYDGDLLYKDMLDSSRLADDYNVGVLDPIRLKDAKTALGALYDKIGQPSPYYALLALDADRMGERVNECTAEEEAKALSIKLAQFASFIRNLGTGDAPYFAHVIYNGGDDLLVMTPLATALDFARTVADKFSTTAGGTLSGGILIVHHTSPLGAALRNLPGAEHVAKSVRSKEDGAICVRAIKRSGETLQVVSRWKDLGGTFTQAVSDFGGITIQPGSSTIQQGQELVSSKMAYELAVEARIATGLNFEEAKNTDPRKAILRRMYKRHGTKDLSDPENRIKSLSTWASVMDNYCWQMVEITPGHPEKHQQGFEELGRWLILARFLSQRGGGE